MTAQTLLRLAAWGSIIAILLVSGVPIEFRPVITHHPTAERFIAFAVVATLFSLAYPKRRIPILVLLLMAAGLFELLKLAAEGRHPTLFDAAVKAAGAITGVWIGAQSTKRNSPPGRSEKAPPL